MNNEMDPSMQEVVNSFSYSYQRNYVANPIQPLSAMPAYDFPTPGIGGIANVFNYVVPISSSSNGFKVVKEAPSEPSLTTSTIQFGQGQGEEEESESR